MISKNDQSHTRSGDDGEDKAKDDGTQEAASLISLTSPLDELHKRLAVIRDRIRGVALGCHTGLYLFGRPGTAKTHTVLENLVHLGCPFEYHNGHLTPLGLFDLLAEHRDRLCVLDDVAELLTNKVALQLLLAALGNQSNGARVVKYRRQRVSIEIRFTGQLVLISNFKFHSSPLLQALRSRVHYINYSPSDEEIAALMYEIARRGWPAENPQLSAEQCIEVTEYTIAESRRLGHRLDLRTLVDKAFPDMLQHLRGETESHWKDLVAATLKEQLVTPEHPLRRPITREDRKRAEQDLVQQIISAHATREIQLATWREQTGKSDRVFYRRLRDLDGTCDILTVDTTKNARNSS